MDTTAYTTLTRQSGLMREMQIVANNIANAATTGYRQEGLIFSEYVQNTGKGPSLSMAMGNIGNTSTSQGALTQTRAPYDFAIEGDGFFLVETPDGEMLTRAGSFSPSSEGDLVTNDGYPVLDAGGAPIFVPPNSEFSVGADGTISADGTPIGQIGLFVPINPDNLVREGGVMFRADEGVDPAENGRILQGFLEQSNVDPIGQIARMIEVQRAYEMGQSFLDAENERVRQALQTFIK